MKRAGIDWQARHLSPHSFRHTVNTIVRNSGQTGSALVQPAGRRETFRISGQTTRGKAEAYANKALGVVKVIFREALYREEIPQEPSASVGTVKYRKEGRAGRLHCRGETAPASDLERTTILVH